MRRWFSKTPSSVLRLAGLHKKQLPLRTFESASLPESQKVQLQTSEDEYDLTAEVKHQPNHVIRKLGSIPSTPDALKYQEDTARKIRTTHLLRYLLREVAYLSDPYARQYLHEHILKRFRAYGFKAWKLRQRDAGQPEEDALYEQRLRAKEKEARNALVSLKRANNGERKCLIRVLFLAYGRIGRRRWELLTPLMAKEAKEDTQNKAEESEEENDGLDAGELELLHALAEDTPAVTSPATTTNSTKAPPKLASPTLDKNSTIKLIPDLSPALRALLQSQVSAHPPALARSYLRRLTADIPALNSWLRPMPQVRVKNKRKELYASLIEKALPPVPTEEWEWLLDVASGRVAIPAVVARRARAAGVGGERAKGSESSNGDRSALETVLAIGKPPTSVLDRRGAHNFTPRFMRRLYRQVLSQCCVMDWDGEKGVWKVTWGERALADAEKRQRTRAFGKDGRSDITFNGYHDWVEWQATTVTAVRPKLVR